MSGRGRGGRGGRGGATRTFNREQLNAMGVTGNEVLPGPVTQPPPLYPLLDKRPVPINVSIYGRHIYFLNTIINLLYIFYNTFSHP